MDLQACVDAVTHGGGFEDIANGAGGESIPSNQHGDIRLGDYQAEANMILVCLRDSKLRLIRLFDELERYKLEKFLDLVSCLSHVNNMAQDIQMSSMQWENESKFE